MIGWLPPECEVMGKPGAPGFAWQATQMRLVVVLTPSSKELRSVRDLKLIGPVVRLPVIISVGATTLKLVLP